MDRVEKIKEFLQKSPADPFLQHALGLELQKMGKINEARQAFETLLLAHPDYVGSYYQLGKLLEQQNEIKLAMSWYEKGMEEARKAGEQRTLNELRAAYEELL